MGASVEWGKSIETQHKFPGYFNNLMKAYKTVNKEIRSRKKKEMTKSRDAEHV